MVYYFMPEVTEEADLKPAYQLVDLLRALDVPLAAATRGGRAPKQLLSQAPIVSRAEAREQVAGEDSVITWEEDWDGPLPAGARHLVHRFAPEPGGGFTEQLAGVGPDEAAVDVGISVASHYRYDGRDKFEDIVACTPTESAALYKACAHIAPRIEYVAIDGVHEAGGAERLKQASLFLATSTDGPRALRVLEALAAGCVVLLARRAAPVPWLRHARNGWICEPTELPEQLVWLMHDDQRRLRRELRDRGLAAALDYTPRARGARLRALLEGPLAFLRS